MRSRFFVIFSALMALASATALAQQAFVPARQGVRSWQSLLPPGPGGAAKVVGAVLDVEQQRVANARVQLRNLVTGSIDGESVSSVNGEYEFTVLDPSTFAVEMVAIGGGIVAVSNAAPVGRSQTLRTIVQLPGRWDAARSLVVIPQQLSNYFGLSTQTTITAGTLRLATQQQISPTDAGEPVSPNF
jgi:hypothetical protein